LAYFDQKKKREKKEKKKEGKEKGGFQLVQPLRGIIQRLHRHFCSARPTELDPWIGTGLPNRHTRGLTKSLGFSTLCQATQSPLQAQGDAHNPIDMHGMAWHQLVCPDWAANGDLACVRFNHL
jgi:hypothetical protein